MRGIYIHVPFCKKKCAYCNFYSGKFKESELDAFTDAVCRNLEHISSGGSSEISIDDMKSSKIAVDTIYFGGGTPSILEPRQIKKIIDCIKSNYNLAKSSEITLEANPGTLNNKKLEGFLECGVNRLSIGMQSFNDNELVLLGRIHNAKTAEDEIIQAKKVGFKNISVDLMIGLPFQKMEDVKYSLKKAISLDIQHVSVYMLIPEEGTPLFENKSLMENLPTDEITADMYEYVFSELENFGIYQYEISNAAKHGYESRHNLKYWNCEEVIATGPASHMFFNGIRSAVTGDTKKFINNKFQENYIVDANPAGSEERFMLSMRLKSGIDLKNYRIKNIGGIRNLIRAGYLESDGKRLFCTRKGFLVQNSLLCDLIDFIDLNL